jgi:hypothetical protein
MTRRGSPAVTQVGPGSLPGWSVLGDGADALLVYVDN